MDINNGAAAKASSKNVVATFYRVSIVTTTEGEASGGDKNYVLRIRQEGLGLKKGLAQESLIPANQIVSVSVATMKVRPSFSVWGMMAGALAGGMIGMLIMILVRGPRIISTMGVVAGVVTAQAAGIGTRAKDSPCLTVMYGTGPAELQSLTIAARQATKIEQTILEQYRLAA